MTQCCFQNEECGYDMTQTNDAMYIKSLNYLKNITGYLTNLEIKNGYDRCHSTMRYDASQCARDCQNSENSRFAKVCKESGGLYKCCIR